MLSHLHYLPFVLHSLLRSLSCKSFIKILDDLFVPLNEFLGDGHRLQSTLCQPFCMRPMAAVPPSMPRSRAFMTRREKMPACNVPRPGRSRHSTPLAPRWELPYELSRLPSAIVFAQARPTVGALQTRCFDEKCGKASLYVQWMYYRPPQISKYLRPRRALPPFLFLRKAVLVAFRRTILLVKYGSLGM